MVRCRRFVMGVMSLWRRFTGSVIGRGLRRLCGVRLVSLVRFLLLMISVRIWGLALVLRLGVLIISRWIRLRVMLTL